MSLDDLHIAGILQLAKVRRKVARRHVKQLLQTRKCHPIARRQRTEGRGDAQPRSGMDDGVEFHPVHRRRFRAAATDPIRKAPPPASAMTRLFVGAPKNGAADPTTSNTTPSTSWPLSRQSAAPARYRVPTMSA